MTAATGTVLTEPCDRCGQPVERQVMGGALADLAAKLKPVCDGCTEAAEAEDRERQEREAEETRQAIFRERVAESGLPPKFRALALDELDHEPAVVSAALSWVVDGGGLLLTGEVGRGKTHVAGAAARARLQRSAVAWLTAPLLFARLGSGLDSPQRVDMLAVLSGHRALVLDDIDKARPTEYGAEQIFLAVDQRVAHKAPLLVTSNLAPSQLAERWPEPYGVAIASRLVGYCKVVRVGGVDRRLAARRSTQATETGEETG